MFALGQRELEKLSMIINDYFSSCRRIPQLLTAVKLKHLLSTSEMRLKYNKI